ncbi:MAG: hypothetical protein ACRD1A_07020, partial [Terriglobales bacterium]
VGAAAGVELLKRAVNAAEDGGERDPGLAPAFDQRPVNGREQDLGAALALEVLLDFGEVVEVVQRAPSVRY